MKVIVAGGRDFTNYHVAREVLVKLMDKTNGDLEIISGMARGADTLGILFAHEFGLAIHKFPAKWNVYGKRAGYIRNVDMASIGDMLIAFWDGKSRGTQHMINIAKEKGLKYIVLDYTGEVKLIGR